jgi:hypothetical protein
VLLKLLDAGGMIGALGPVSVGVSFGLLVPLKPFDAFLDELGYGFARVRGGAILGARPGRGGLAGQPGEDLRQYPALTFLLSLNRAEPLVE